jgi:surface polysaccharide O-acyltransferase-like enzyme
MTWLGIGVAAVLSFPILYIVSEGQFSSLLGGFHWRPFIFALWEAFVCIGLCVGLLIYCRENLNNQGRLGKTLSENAYSIYLVHVPVVIFAQYILIGAALHPLIKFSLVTLGGLFVSLLISQCMRKLLFSRKMRRST